MSTNFYIDAILGLDRETSLRRQSYHSNRSCCSTHHNDPFIQDSSIRQCPGNQGLFCVLPMVYDHHHHHHTTPSMIASNSYNYNNDAKKNNIISNNNNTNSNTGTIKKKRSWTRAVFSSFQRNNLEMRFAMQKYIAKPDRKKLAEDLNLKDEQVKVWFQNRRMKWRHSKEHEDKQRQVNLTDAILNSTSNNDSHGDDSNSLEIDLSCSSKENQM